MLRGSGVADTGQHVSNGIGDLHDLSSLFRVTGKPGDIIEVPGQYVIERGLSMAFWSGIRLIGRCRSV
jgi:hypothetical protein